MPAKPTAENILKNYSFDEILDLAKEKARTSANEKLAEAMRHLSALSEAIDGEQRFPTASAKKPTKIGRPKRVIDKRSKNALPLGAMILEVLGSEPMGIESILLGLKKRRWKSASKNPRGLLNSELKRQTDKGSIRKTERGMYVKV